MEERALKRSLQGESEAGVGWKASMAACGYEEKWNEKEELEGENS